MAVQKASRISHSLQKSSVLILGNKALNRVYTRIKMFVVVFVSNSSHRSTGSRAPAWLIPGMKQVDIVVAKAYNVVNGLMIELSNLIEG